MPLKIREEKAPGVALGCVGFVLVLLLTGALNRAGLFFEISEGVALVFPAAAVVVVGALLFRWWGVAGAFPGFLLMPWGLSNTPLRALYFAAAGTLLGVIPMLALRRGPRSGSPCIHALAWTVGANSLISAAIGVSGVFYLTGFPTDFQEALTVFLSWFFADAIAIILLGLPILLAIRPSMLLASHQQELYARWRTRPRYFLPPLLGVLVVGGVMEVFRAMDSLHVHWLAAAFLLPILMAAGRGGVGAALQTNALAGLLYLHEVLRFSASLVGGNFLTEVVSSYLNLMVFCVASVSVGIVWGRSESLLRELDEHRRRLQNNFELVVTALAAAVEAKDPLTEGHVQRVARMAVAVGRKLEISDTDLELLRYGALLHDVGKIGVPEEILNKPGPLDDSERQRLEDHVDIGVDILSSVDILAPAIPMIRYHQERWDGRMQDSGLKYPGYFGLAGEDIPLGARIIAVVDAWDAMTNDRPYRRALMREDAIEEMKRESGRQFEPRVVDALFSVLESEERLESGDRIPILGLRIA